MRSLANKTNVQAPDSDYPYARIRDKTATTSGTPVNEEVYGDFHQFFEKMMAEAGMVANELPDNDYNGFQLFEALFKSMYNYFVQIPDGGRKLVTKLVEIGPWNMDADQDKQVNVGVAHSKIRDIRVSILIDGSTGESIQMQNILFISGGPFYGAGGCWFYAGANTINIQRFSDADVVAMGLDNTKVLTVFDSSSFSSLGQNRGYVLVTYEP